MILPRTVGAVASAADAIDWVAVWAAASATTPVWPVKLPTIPKSKLFKPDIPCSTTFSIPGPKVKYPEIQVAATDPAKDNASTRPSLEVKNFK